MLQGLGNGSPTGVLDMLPFPVQVELFLQPLCCVAACNYT
jgi:hypothetical protein